MSSVPTLRNAAYGIHFADQIALVAVPLVAALAFEAPADVIGLLVACQSLAHLVGSVPFGVMVDQRPLRALAIVAAVVSMVGFAGAALAVQAQSLVGFAICVTGAGFGAVLFGLTALSILPREVAASAMARANAQIEIPRAVSSFAVPLAVGLVISDVPGAVLFAAASLGGGFALIQCLRLRRFASGDVKRVSVLRQIVHGGQFVRRHSILRPIAFCAVFWNFAFAVLLVALVPAIQEVFRFDPGSFGIALAAFGLAAILGAWLAGAISERVAPSVILLFGPGSSFVAAAGLLLIAPDGGAAVLYLCFFGLGFGPSMWLIAQNSVRQLVTPPDMLGRVNAVIQMAIYGVRPLGALAGGAVSASFGAERGLALAAVAFAVSFGVSVFSDLRRVASYGGLRVS
ncbi:MFS transporter [Shimia abyssi]|uniref:Putative MFS family arabinose efflux permease n=1 Tax=Shimia abyssi TaxID=1662395 RepID=A0A2P8FBM0_9RHOB|nr:MFS transporter [Shimia abyssi]PSL19131.1 putative MFS family arabinose efflux permease [Shimia abyssi]